MKSSPNILTGIIFKTVSGETCLYNFSTDTLSIVDIEDDTYSYSISKTSIDAVTSVANESGEILEHWSTWFTMEPNELAHLYIANLLKNKNKLKTFKDFVLYTISSLRSGKKLPSDVWGKDCLKLSTG